MAHKKKKEPVFFKKDKIYVQRFFYDVLMYTLPKSGLSEEEFPPIENKQNVYNRADFLEIAGATTLRIALNMRNIWKRMFVSRRNSSGISKDDIAGFLGNIVACCPLTGERTIKSTLEVYLAVCNEVIMFCHCEGIDFCLNTVIDAACMQILYLFVSYDLNVSETIEKLFDDFTDISSYSELITDFITNFTIPCESKKDARDRFEKEDKKRYNDAVEKASFPEKTPIKKLRNYLGFLPHELYSAITLEESIDLPGNLVLASESILPGDRESPEPPTLPAISASCAVGGRNSGRRMSTQSGNASEQAAQGGKRGNNSSELGIEDDLGRMTLVSEGVSRGSQERYQSEKRSKRKNKRSKRYSKTKITPKRK